MITRTDRNQTWDPHGNLLDEEVVEVDVTDEVCQWDAHERLRRHAADPNPDLQAWLVDVTRLLLAVDGARDLLVKDTSE